MRAPVRACVQAIFTASREVDPGLVQKAIMAVMRLCQRLLPYKSDISAPLLAGACACACGRVCARGEGGACGGRCALRGWSPVGLVAVHNKTKQKLFYLCIVRQGASTQPLAPDPPPPSPPALWACAAQTQPPCP